MDIGKGCDDVFAYMSDELGYGLIVYDWKENKSWRATHSYFMPDPLAGDYNIGGLNFQWGEEGIFGLSLSPIAADGFRTLFFHPLSSNREFAVSTRILRNEELALDSYHEFQASGFVILVWGAKKKGAKGAVARLKAGHVQTSGIHVNNESSDL